MTNNKSPMNANKLSDVSLIRAQTRLLKLHSKLKRKGGWRAVQKYLGLKNISYAFEFVTKGKLSNNPEIRAVLLSGKPWRERKPMAMNPFMQRLEYVMKRWHLGKGKAIKKWDLLVEIYGSYAIEDRSNNNPYDRELRSMIEGLNHDHGGLICSTPDVGYFWASSLNEGLDAVQHSTLRAAHQMENARHLETNLQREFGGQLTMEV